MQPVTVIEPRDETDRFCTCPACGLAGSHYVDVISTSPRDRIQEITTEMRVIADLEPGQVTARVKDRFDRLRRELEHKKAECDPRVTMINPTLPGRTISVPPASVRGHEAMGWQRLAERNRYRAHRTCLFCEHVWETPAAGPTDDEIVQQLIGPGDS